MTENVPPTPKYAMTKRKGRDGYTTITIWQHWAKQRGLSNWKQASCAADIESLALNDFDASMAAGMVELEDFPGYFITRFGNVWKGPWVQHHKTGKTTQHPARLLSRFGRNFAYVQIGPRFVNWQKLKEKTFPPE